MKNAMRTEFLILNWINKGRYKDRKITSVISKFTVA